MYNAIIKPKGVPKMTWKVNTQRHTLSIDELHMLSLMTKDLPEPPKKDPSSRHNIKKNIKETWTNNNGKATTLHCRINYSWKLITVLGVERS